MDLISFRLSHAIFAIWDITQKAHILDPQLLEISEIEGIFHKLRQISVPDGCKPIIFMPGNLYCIRVVSQKYIFWIAHTRHIDVAMIMQKFRIFCVFSQISDISAAHLCALCVPHKLFMYFVRILHP